MLVNEGGDRRFTVREFLNTLLRMLIVGAAVTIGRYVT